MSRSAEKYAGKIIDRVVQRYGPSALFLKYRELRALLEHAYDAGHEDALRVLREERKDRDLQPDTADA